MTTPRGPEQPPTTLAETGALVLSRILMMAPQAFIGVAFVGAGYYIGVQSCGGELQALRDWIQHLVAARE